MKIKDNKNSTYKTDFKSSSKFKIFLVNNKIYFESFNLFIFAVITIFIWFNANNLLKIQNDITIKEKLPYIYLQTYLTWTNREDYILNVFNNWGNIYNYSINTYSKLKISTKDNKMFLFRLYYFNTQFWWDYKNNLLNTEYWYKNNFIYNNFYFKLWESFKYNYPELENYLEIRYEDIFWKSHINYFKIFSDHWIRLDDIEWNKIIETIKSYKELKLEDLNILNLDKILN